MIQIMNLICSFISTLFKYTIQKLLFVYIIIFKYAEISVNSVHAFMHIYFV